MKILFTDVFYCFCPSLSKGFVYWKFSVIFFGVDLTD